MPCPCQTRRPKAGEDLPDAGDRERTPPLDVNPDAGENTVPGRVVDEYATFVVRVDGTIADGRRDRLGPVGIAATFDCTARR